MQAIDRDIKQTRLGLVGIDRRVAASRRELRDRSDLVGKSQDADAIAFAGGIGENSPLVRLKACEGLERLGIKLDPALNAETIAEEGEISSPDSPTKVFVIPTNEELVIARDTVRCVEGVI